MIFLEIMNAIVVLDCTVIKIKLNKMNKKLLVVC